MPDVRDKTNSMHFRSYRIRDHIVLSHHQYMTINKKVQYNKDERNLFLLDDQITVSSFR